MPMEIKQAVCVTVWLCLFFVVAKHKRWVLVFKKRKKGTIRFKVVLRLNYLVEILYEEWKNFV